MKRNQSGFSVIEVVMAIVIVGLLGVVGWMYWTNIGNGTTNTHTATTQETETKTKTPAPTPTPLPLKTYKLKTQPLAFDYPATWSTQATLYTGKGSVNSESVEVSSPDGFTLQLGTFGDGLGGTGPCDRSISDFKYEGSVDPTLKSDNGIVSYMLDKKTFILNIAGKTLDETKQNCRGYQELVNLRTILTGSENGEVGEEAATNLVFGTNVLFQNAVSTSEPSDSVYKEAVTILKSLRKV